MSQEDWTVIVASSDELPPWTTLEVAMAQAESLASARGEENVRLLRRTDGLTLSYESAVIARASTRGLAWFPMPSARLERDVGKALHTTDTKHFARAAVPGGWLVRSMENLYVMSFVPDPEHEWDGTSSVLADKILRDSNDAA